MKNQKRNDKEREMWIQNDEALYRWKRRTGGSMRAFIKANRAELDAYIDRQLSKEPARAIW